MPRPSNRYGERNRPTRRGLWSASIVRSATIVSVVLVVILFGGLLFGAYAASGHTMGKTPPTLDNSSTTGANHASAASNSSLHVVALGDSLTHGFGDASGSGYVGDVVNDLRHQGTTVSQTNLGVDGLTSTGLLQELQQRQIRHSISTANVILISIGGNDLNNAAGLPAIHPQKIASAETVFQQNLKKILTTLRNWNPQAPILLVGLYNPYGDIASTRVQTDNIVAAWNADELKIVDGFPFATVVQTYDLFYFNPQKFLYVDHFHPNQAGYSLMADRIWQVLKTTSVVSSYLHK